MKKIKIYLIISISILISVKLFCQYSIPVTIATEVFWPEGADDEWIHLRITDTINDLVVYDTLAYVPISGGFKDTVILDTGIYKCEIITMGALIYNPTIKLKDGTIIPYGYPDFEYYLIRLKNTYSTINPVGCETYTSPSGKYVWDSSGVYYDTIPNSIGCDNYITANLIIGNPSTSVLNHTACEVYTVPSGDEIYSESGTYMDTLSNVFGCDSVMTINVTITKNTIAAISPTACSSYLAPSGNKTYYESGTYLDTLINSVGCDSLITIDLNIIPLDNGVTLADGVLSAIEVDASYQWLTCNTNNPISGATNQSYTPIVSGLYMVRITKDDCEVLSECQSVIVTDSYKSNLKTSLISFPNPTHDNFNIFFNKNYSEIYIEIIDISGRIISSQFYNNQNQIKLNLVDYKSGFYYIKISADKRNTSLKVLKK
jgi:hypothetical protein